MARTLAGVVSSNKGNKTIVVTVTGRKTHPIYKKQYTVTTRFMAHDDKNEAKVGDQVVIIESRPASARKRFQLQKIIEKGGVRFEEADAMVGVVKETIGETDEAETKTQKPQQEKA